MNAICKQPSRLLNPSLRPGCRYTTGDFLRQRLSHNIGSRLGLRYASDAPQTPTRYPQRLSIFRSPTLATALVGTSKFLGLGIFMLGCLVVAPAAYQDPTSPSWLPPAFVVAGACPLILIHLANRPFVVNVFIDAPAVARRSKESLIAFARRLPPDTRVEIETLGLLPVPRTTALRLSDLRFRPMSALRLANLERHPAIRPKSFWSRLSGTSLNRFYASPNEKCWKRSRAPEVWPLVLESIGKNTHQGLALKPVRPTTMARPSWSQVVQKPVSPPASALQKSRQSSRKK